MTHRIVSTLAVGISVLLLAVPARAADETLQERFKGVQQAFNDGKAEEGVTLLQQMHRDYPDDATAALNLGDLYGKSQAYDLSTQYYTEGLQRLQRASAPPQALALIHQALVNGYNELGQQRYFSPELCLRILYHMDRSWPQIVKDNPTPEALRPVMEFARKTIGHYDMASIAPNVRMMERSPTAALDVSGAMQDDELILPDDGIAAADKLKAKETIAGRIRTFDGAQPSEYAAQPSGRATEEIFEQLENAYRQVKSIMYRKHQTIDKRETLVESSWYQYPQQLKTRQQGTWMMIKDGVLTYFDPTEQRIISQRSLGGEPGWLMEIRKPNRQFMEASYEWEVKKLSNPPNFLGSLYATAPANLYLLTGKAKSPDGAGYPPVVKSEYVVDLDKGLLVGLREYWHGILGSGHDEELATTDVVTQWKQYAENIFIPVAGRREQLVDEGLTHRIQNSTWRIEVEQLNVEFEPETFDLTPYTQAADR